jgi:3-methyladenine DNA glycosylase/8-oxoguanine DNA glycosylase
LPVNHAAAHRHLNAKDKRLAAHIRQVARERRYGLTPQRGLRPFDALAESIAYQQLSGKAAAIIWNRVRALFPGHKFLDPRLVLDTPDEKFRAAGLSRSKISALKDLAMKTLDGTVPTPRQLAEMADEAIIERLVHVRGVGRWTVEMLLLFELARPDVWPVHDYGVRKGFAKIFRKRRLPTPKEMMKHGARFQPYRSLLAWYCWRALDKPEPSGNRS